MYVLRKIGKISQCVIKSCHFYRSENHNMSCIIRKPAFGVCKNKGADQLSGKRRAGQCLYFGYIDSTIPLLSKSEISSP